MAFDSIANASIPMAAANAKDIAKRKRPNRSAKLKQCKLDARREQWLSQVKNKGCEEESDGGNGIRATSMNGDKERDRSIGSLDINPRGEVNDGSMHRYIDWESPSNSPTIHTISVSGSNFIAGNSSSGSSGGCCSGNVTEEEGDDGCLDDWEAVADALAATDDKQEHHSPNSESPPRLENVARLNSPLEPTSLTGSTIEISKPKPECVVALQRAPATTRAWRSDDAFRPPGLPNLAKQHSFPMKSDRNYGRGGTAWVCNNVLSSPLSCLVCYEDMDFTDENFCPCSCGFRLCLFCHKKILEVDGRCPGCRKQYDHDSVEGEATLVGGSLTFRLARCCSMVTRS